ncbi:tRNA (carboxymethyluridine(34)-5-O)-methyltransferase [Malassezia cuniculi]|uniref:tRNA (Carboxymethyluridine(34)-5-O)-methyltransferase n=1 Tax=Malassezia cuniculi TaxID=948313 RepID=A0AAF0EUL6_9BASI|nr:tRNA (carboxymethyluridine(34)-5-O)-methyltransferase [Malassezia cuniculi]
MARAPVTPAREFADARAFEEDNVHAWVVPADRPWPLVPAFLATLPPGSVGADLGCGNGKYLGVASVVDGSGHLLTIGSDRCAPLVSDAQKNAKNARLNEVAVADALCSGFRAQTFDYALSIATIHHFSTEERRRQSVQEMIRVVKPVRCAATPGAADTRESSEAGGGPPVITGHGPGRFMIYVWALEQRGGGRRQFDTALAEQGDATVQDVLVPWVSTGQHNAQGVHERCELLSNQTTIYFVSAN